MFFKQSNLVARILASKILWLAMLIVLVVFIYANTKNAFTLRKIYQDLANAKDKQENLKNYSANLENKLHSLSDSNDLVVKENLGLVKEGEQLVVFRPSNENISDNASAKPASKGFFQTILDYLKNLGK